MAWLDPSDYRAHLVSHLTLFLKTHAPFASAERSSLIPFPVLRNLAPYQAKTRLYKGSASIGSIGGSDPFCVRFESIESFSILSAYSVYSSLSEVPVPAYRSLPSHLHPSVTLKRQLLLSTSGCTLPLSRYKAPRFLTSHNLSSLTSSHLNPYSQPLIPLKPPSQVPWAVVSRSRMMSPSCTPSPPPTRLSNTSTLFMLLLSTPHK